MWCGQIVATDYYSRLYFFSKCDWKNFKDLIYEMVKWFVKICSPTCQSFRPIIPSEERSWIIPPVQI